jgi:peptide/nickel transport system substrate-binding protein
MGRREKITFLILVALVVGSGFFGARAVYINATVPAPGHGGEYREAIIGQPRFINPLLATTTTDQSIVRLVFSGLYKYDGNGEVIPDLAESMPQLSDDEKQYTVKLRHDAKWHNDTSVTADDVVFTIKTLQDPAYNSPLRTEWLSTTVDKIDDYTVVFTVKDVSGPFFHNLTLPLISHAIWEQISPNDFLLSQANIEATGSGPYLIREVRKLSQGTIQSIKLESFTNYHNSRANIDVVRLNFYNTTEDVINAIHGKLVDGFGFTPFETNVRLDRSSSAFRTLQTPLPEYQAVFFNLSNRLFQDASVRRALVMATDRDAIIRDVFDGNGQPINGPIPPNLVSGISPATLVYNEAEAAKLLDSVGWRVNTQTGVRTKNNVPLEFTLSTNEYSLNAQTAELLMQQWQKINVKVRLNIQPTKDLTDNLIRPRSFEALLFVETLGADPDPFIFWHSSQAKNPGLNVTGYTSAVADKLISEARATTDQNVRDEKYRQFEALIEQDAPAIFLVQSLYTYTLDTRIQGFSIMSLPDAEDRFYNLPSWYVRERRVLKSSQK